MKIQGKDSTMNCPHCGKPISNKQISSYLRSRMDPEKAKAASRRNGAKGGRPRIFPRSMKGRPLVFMLADGSYEVCYRGTRERHSRLASGIVSITNPIIRRQAVKLVRKVERARKQETKKGVLS